jgi:hypothetical protein
MLAFGVNYITVLRYGTDWNSCQSPWGRVRLSPLRLPTYGLLYQPRMMDDDECGAVRSGNRENLSQCCFVHHNSKTTWSGLESLTATLGSQEVIA